MTEFGHTCIKFTPLIIKHFPKQVAFVQPSSTTTEYIYSAQMEVSTVLEILLKPVQNLSDEEEEEDEDDAIVHDEHDENMAIFHCGIILNRILKSVKTSLPWPPSPDDFSKDNIDVPDLLYNLLAYMLTGSDVPAEDGEHVEVDEYTDRSILSVAQDMINIAGKGHVLTVKNLGLAIAIRNITGNKDVSIMLNKFGHTVSYA